MALNEFLKSRIPYAKKLVNLLSEEYDYVSVLGTYTKFKKITTNKNISDMADLDKDAGFVIKLFKNKEAFEYSCNDIKDLDVKELKEAITLSSLQQERVALDTFEEEKIEQSFTRLDESNLTDNEILERLTKIRKSIEDFDKRIIQVQCILQKREVNSIFVSKNKCLDQVYNWSNVMTVAVSRQEDIIKQAYTTENDVNTLKALNDMEAKAIGFAQLAINLLKAKPIVPGTYEIISHPTISGLIAHEAFGHGVELDMFVKNRAKAKDYVGKQVASEKVSMHDGAASTLSSASYFFDDDGILAHDTCIIDKGILKHGISDLLSAMQLKQEPSGNGRRQSFDHKSYSRMTNTFFMPGDDDVDKMIASISHGYMLIDTDNGMEDPKNWGIQCTASYGLEIKDGKFTGEIVAPVVISGYVVDLLKSITMVSKEFKVTGSGMCGKGYKEWVYVADGGPYMKVVAKLS